MEKIIIFIKKLIQFFTKDIWRFGDRNLSRSKLLSINLLRKIILSVKGFFSSELMAKSATLSYYTVLSIVPIFAILIAIGRGFGISDKVNEMIGNTFASQSELVPYITQFVNNYLEQVSGGIFIGIGVVFLLWTVISTFQQVEDNFNKIWNVEKSRSFVHQFTTYISLIVIIPVFVSLSSGFSIYISQSMNSVLGNFYSPINKILMQIVPYFFYWILFTLLYKLVPNTKVKFIHALFAGIVCGTIFQLFQYLYINGQINLSKYNNVYGAFAAIPLFFFWLQISWLIVLYGAELAFVSQNLKDNYYRHNDKKSSGRVLDFIKLVVVKIIIRRFQQNLPPTSIEDIANATDLPIRLICDIVHQLTKINLLIEITDEDQNRAYMPAIDINLISVGLIFDRIERFGEEDYELLKNSEYHDIWSFLEQHKQENFAKNKSILIKDL